MGRAEYSKLNMLIYCCMFILIIALIIAIVLFVRSVQSNQTEGMTNMIDSKYKWSRNNCPYVMNDTLSDELTKNKIGYSKDTWDIYFPCTYDDINSELNLMQILPGAKYFIVDGSDNMVAKDLLWKNVVDMYGLQKALSFMPNSYILYNKQDIQRLHTEYDPNKIYIMKKNIQRQEGLKITKNKNEILKGYDNGYVIVQELLQNPYVISGRKTNMRFYLLVDCYDGKVSAHVYNDGFMYYTKDLFIKGSTDDGPNITTGYIDRKVYEENPLTHSDLKLYLDDPHRKLTQVEYEIRHQGKKISLVYFTRIYELLKNIILAFTGKICQNKNFSKNLMFQLYGVDVAVDDKLNPMIMEINKGPDLGAKDERDSKLKHGLVHEIFNKIGLITTNDNNTDHFITLF